jgi:hypothetical protein
LVVDAVDAGGSFRAFERAFGRVERTPRRTLRLAEGSPPG